MIRPFLRVSKTGRDSPLVSTYLTSCELVASFKGVALKYYLLSLIAWKMRGQNFQIEVNFLQYISTLI